MRRQRFVFIARNVAASAAVALFTGSLSLAQVNSPPIGIARLSDASLRMIYGLPGNLVVDSHVAGTYDAASFSDQAGLLSKNGVIQLVEPSLAALGEYDGTELQPLLNVDGGPTSAIAWLPASRSLLHWDGSKFVVTAVNGLDNSLQVSAVRMSGAGAAEMLVSNSEGFVFDARISLGSGNLISMVAMPGARGQAFWQSGFLLYSDSKGLEVMAPNGVVQTISLSAGELSFERISSKWVLITSASQSRAWALELSAGTFELSEMPAVRAVAQEITK